MYNIFITIINNIKRKLINKIGKREKMYLSIDTDTKKDIFVALFSQLKNFTNLVNLIFYKDYLFIQGMDKSHVCLFDIKIYKEWFSTYEFSNDDNNNICIVPQIFHTILSTAGTDHKLIIHYEGNPDEILIDLQVKENVKGEFSNYFRIPLAEYDGDILEVPESGDYDAEITINAKKLYDITGKMMSFGDTIKVNCSSSETDVTLSVNGVVGEMSTKIPIDDLEEYSVVEEDNIELFYSLNYVHKMCLTTKLSDNVEISIGRECPMKMKYDLGDKSRVLFCLAPKLED